MWQTKGCGRQQSRAGNRGFDGVFYNMCVTVAGILISSVKVPAALTLAEVIDVARTVD